MEHLPEKVTLQFKGVKGVKLHYTGIDPETNEKVECHIKQPDSCLVQVSPAKARQLLVDFTGEWVLPGKAKETEPLYDALMKYTPLKPVANAKPSKNIQIIEPDGKVTEVPAGATVQIINPPKATGKKK